MIAEHDIKILENIKRDIDKRAIAKDKIDWNASSQIETLDRILSNLRIAHLSYRIACDEDISNNYFTAECDKCNWWGSSKLLDGGGSIADTGDYFDCTCPVCGNPDIDEKEL